MALINGLLLTLLLANGEIHDLVYLSSDSFAVVKVSSTYEILIYREDQEILHQIPETLRGLETKYTPSGEEILTPTYKLIGASIDELFLRHHQRPQLIIYQLNRKTLREVTMVYPRNPLQIIPTNNDLMVTAAMITKDSQDVEGAFFVTIDREGQVLDHYGFGKPFMKTFVDQDFPTTFYEPKSDLAGIYYRGSGTLLQFQNGKTRKEVHVDRSALPNEDRMTPELVYALPEGIYMVKLQKEKTTTYRLEQNRWVTHKEIQGTFKRGLVVSNKTVLLDETGRLKIDSW